MYMSVPIAQFIPPPPYPLLTVSLFSIPVALSYFCFVSKFICSLFWGSLVGQMVKKLPAMWEIWVQPLGWEDPLKESMKTPSTILD